MIIGQSSRLNHCSNSGPGHVVALRLLQLLLKALATSALLRCSWEQRAFYAGLSFSSVSCVICTDIDSEVPRVGFCMASNSQRPHKRDNVYSTFSWYSCNNSNLVYLVRISIQHTFVKTITYHRHPRSINHMIVFLKYSSVAFENALRLIYWYKRGIDSHASFPSPPLLLPVFEWLSESLVSTLFRTPAGWMASILVQGITVYLSSVVVWKLIRNYVVKSPLDIVPGPPPASLITGEFNKISVIWALIFTARFRSCQRFISRRRLEVSWRDSEKMWVLCFFLFGFVQSQSLCRWKRHDGQGTTGSTSSHSKAR